MELDGMTMMRTGFTGLLMVMGLAGTAGVAYSQGSLQARTQTGRTRPEAIAAVTNDVNSICLGYRANIQRIDCEDRGPAHEYRWECSAMFRCE